MNKVERQGGRFMVLFKSGGCKVSPRFHILVFDVDQPRNEGAGWVQDYSVWPQGWKDSP